jgi:thiol:disulfide interchange protein
MRRFLILTALLAGAILSSPADDGTNTRTRFDPARDAAKDIEQAVRLASASGRRVLLDVGGEWCVWCHRLDQLFADNPDLSAFLEKHYVVVKVNWSKENKNEEVLSRYPKVAGYPHLFVLEKDGSLLHSQETGALEEGKGHSKEKVLAFLKEWAPPAPSAKER